MNNAERFLEIYNQIDKILKNKEQDEYVSFTKKVKTSSNKIIQAHKDKILDYAELRNAIVHNPRVGKDYIAIPIDKVVSDFEAILKKITSPTKVIPTFQFEVYGAKLRDDLDDILKKMYKHSFSQFPVFNEEGAVIELINSNTISRWLSKQTGKDGIIVENPTIEILIPEIEFKQNYMFIDRNCDLYTAYSLFITQIETRNRNLDVLFITNSGRPKEKLLGLITIEDIASKI